MDALPIPDWVRNAPDVLDVKEWHLPPGSGISGPPAGAYLLNAPAENALRPLPMWHILLSADDEALQALEKSRVLVLACSVVPIFQVYPFPWTIEGELVETL